MQVDNLSKRQENLACALVLIGFVLIFTGNIIAKNINSINIWIIGYYFLGWISISSATTIMYPIHASQRIRTISVVASSIILTLCSIANKI